MRTKVQLYVSILAVLGVFVSSPFIHILPLTPANG